MIKRRKVKKKSLFIIVIILGIFCLVMLLINFGGGNIKTKLVNLGYQEDEVEKIINNVPSNGYHLLKKYDKSILDLISSKNYNPKLFSKYYEYYSRNKKSNIKNII